MYYAQINNGRVVNTAESSAPIVGANIVEVDASVKAGDLDNGDGTFSTPDPVEVPTPRRITTLAFRNRFTSLEKATIEFASIDDPGADTAMRMQQAGLRASLKDQAQARFIDLDDASTIAGVQMLEAVGWIESGRADAILSAPVQPGEAA